MCLEMMPSRCRQVNWGNCGIPWVNCAVLCVWKTTGKDSFKAPAIACQNCAVYSVFSVRYYATHKIAQFNWECIGRVTAINSFTFVDFIWLVGVAVLWRQNASVVPVPFCALADVNAVFMLSCQCIGHQIHSHKIIQIPKYFWHYLQ